MNEAQNPSCYELAALSATPGGEMTRRWLLRPAVRPRLDVLLWAIIAHGKGFHNPSVGVANSMPGARPAAGVGRWCATTEHAETAPGGSDRRAAVNAGSRRGVWTDRGARAPRWGWDLPFPPSSCPWAAFRTRSVVVVYMAAIPRKRRDVVDMMEERPYTVSLCRHDFGECRQPPGTGDQAFSSSV
jgi:hypothetical protein